MSHIKQKKIRKSHIVYGIKFMHYTGPDEAVENILDDHNANQFWCTLYFIEKTIPW